MAKKKPTTTPSERIKLSLKTTTIVLTEAGYRCAVPTCRQILALDMHHIWEVSAGGGNDPANLIALCPTCHRLYHRGTISPESIYAYKAMLVALSNAFDIESIDKLLFLHKIPKNYLALSGDGVLQFARLIAADLVEFEMKANNAWQIVTYTLQLTQKGKLLVDSWVSGDRESIQSAFTIQDPDINELLGGPIIVMPPANVETD